MIEDPGKDGDNAESGYSSFEEFVIEIHPRLRASAGRWVEWNSQLAQDLVQDTFLKLWQRHKARQEAGEALDLNPGFAFTTLRNTVFDHFRKEEVRTRKKDKVEARAATYTASDPAVFVTEDDATRKFFESLGEQQQKIVLLLDGGYTPEEISAEIGRAEGTVRNHLSAIRAAAQRAFPDALRRRVPDN